MSEAAAALTGLESVARLLLAKPRLPVSACADVARKLFAEAASPTMPDEDVVEAIRRTVKSACDAGELDRLTPRDVRMAPLVLWDRDPQGASLPGLLDVLLHRTTESSRALRTMLEAWLRDFGPDRVRHEEAGRAIAGLLPRSDNPRLAFWRTAHESFSVFDAKLGPARLGKALLSGPESLGEVMQRSGMSDRLRAEGKFYLEAVRAVLAGLPSALSGPTAAAVWGRAAELLEVERVDRDRWGRETRRPALRVPGLTGDVIRACLDPWKDGKAHATAPRKEVETFLVRTIGDPRLRPERWKAAPEVYAQLMRGWLASASLAAFFALISEISNDTQWEYRREFWSACLRKMPSERPAEVWVALGSRMANRAKFVDELKGAFGAMESGDQAVLLMRFGNLVLTEWSNVGPVRAWDHGDKRCPVLYRQRYDADDLRADGLHFPHEPAPSPGQPNGKGLWHRKPKKGLWQGQAAALLRAKIGLRLDAREYMKI